MKYDQPGWKGRNGFNTSIIVKNRPRRRGHIGFGDRCLKMIDKLIWSEMSERVFS